MIAAIHDDSHMIAAYRCLTLVGGANDHRLPGTARVVFAEGTGLTTEESMPTREQVWAALALDNDYPRLAHEWGMPAGRLYLIANGRPADCSDGRDGRSQVLVNPREVNPTARGDVRAWMKRRAYADGAMRGQG